MIILHENVVDIVQTTLRNDAQSASTAHRF
jgi:hypothetical protein